MNAKICRIIVAGLMAGLGVSCTTAYDAYGRPVQMVDPGVAVAGAAAAGLLAYGLSESRHHHRGHGHYHRGRSYYRGGHGYHRHGGGYYRPYYGRSHHHHRYYR